MKLFLSFLVFVLLVVTLGSGFVHAADTPANALLVLAKHDGTLAIVDPSSLQVIARIPVGKDPHEVITSSDGKTAYVSNYGFGAYNTLAVVDLVAQKGIACNRSRSFARSAWIDIRRRKNVVHRRRRQGNRQI